MIFINSYKILSIRSYLGKFRKFLPKEKDQVKKRKLAKESFRKLKKFTFLIKIKLWSSYMSRSEILVGNLASSLNAELRIKLLIKVTFINQVVKNSLKKIKLNIEI